jgi:membrane protease YdiL (CAAX protease family)
MTSMTAEGQAPVAPWRHTRILCAILLMIAAAGFIASRFAGGAPSAPGGAPVAPGVGPGVYVMLLSAELALLYTVRNGLRRGGTRLMDIISRRRLGPGTIAFDLAIGLGLFCNWVLIGRLLASYSQAGTPALVQRLVVHDPAEIPLWVAVSLAAGFVEELTFRGYFQRQFASRLGRPLGILAQSVLFGVTHGYQGLGSMIAITLFGIVFGIVAWARGSLLPGMAAHAAIDVIGGLQLLR